MHQGQGAVLYDQYAARGAIDRSDTIDCASPGSTVTLKAVYGGNNDQWYGPYGPFLSGNTVTASVAGTYILEGQNNFSTGCPATGKIKVAFEHMFLIHIENCTDRATPLFRLGIDTVPPIRSVILEQGENMLSLLHRFPPGMYSVALSRLQKFSKMVVTAGR